MTLLAYLPPLSPNKEKKIIIDISKIHLKESHGCKCHIYLHNYSNFTVDTQYNLSLRNAR